MQMQLNYHLDANLLSQMQFKMSLDAILMKLDATQMNLDITWRNLDAIKIKTC